MKISFAQKSQEMQEKIDAALNENEVTLSKLSQTEKDLSVLKQ